ncbi:DUF2238 domain-containing protein [Candidatus Woesearchaeota archaeon]|nr:DUF2238 domain-containing protein [Candidatus Woesearchaeota archaeon]
MPEQLTKAWCGYLVINFRLTPHKIAIFIYSKKKNSSMLIKREQWPVFTVHTLALIVFTAIFVLRKDYEFLLYVAVILFFMLLVLFTNHKVEYPNALLWGLAIWSIMHMSGSGIYIGGKKLYDTILIPIIGEPYSVFKYDQLAHIFGFAVATYLSYILLKPSLSKEPKWRSLSIVILMAGLGFGALNEIIEFFATVLIPNTGVGGYVNTAIDLVSNAFGAAAAVLYILAKESKDLNK